MAFAGEIHISFAGFSAQRAPPEIEWLIANGSCYTAAETRSFARALGLKPANHAGFQPAKQWHGGKFGQDHQTLLRPDSRILMQDWLNGLIITIRSSRTTR
jgi:transposase InsO family protein